MALRNGQFPASALVPRKEILDAGRKAMCAAVPGGKGGIVMRVEIGLAARPQAVAQFENRGTIGGGGGSRLRAVQLIAGTGGLSTRCPAVQDNRRAGRTEVKEASKGRLASVDFGPPPIALHSRPSEPARPLPAHPVRRRQSLDGRRQWQGWRRETACRLLLITGH